MTKQKKRELKKAIKMALLPVEYNFYVGQGLERFKVSQDPEELTALLNEHLLNSGIVKVKSFEQWRKNGKI